MSHYKDWSKSFRGYSTRYIWNYLKWFRYRKIFAEYNKMYYHVQRSVSDKVANIRYWLIPEYYKDFILTFERKPICL
jgi:hypothetical protein